MKELKTIEAEIKKRYLLGEKIKTLSEEYKQYGISSKTIENWAFRKKWASEKRGIIQAVAGDLRTKVAALSEKMLKELERILDDRNSSKADKIAASRIIADLSGLKTQVNIKQDKPMDEERLEAIEKQLGLNFNSENRKQG